MTGLQLNFVICNIVKFIIKSLYSDKINYKWFWFEKKVRYEPKSVYPESLYRVLTVCNRQLEKKYMRIIRYKLTCSMEKMVTIYTVVMNKKKFQQIFILGKFFVLLSKWKLS